MSEPVPDLKLIFAQALEFNLFDERDRYLAEACGSDPALRDEVDSLLAAHAGAGTFLETPFVPRPSCDGPLAAEGPGSVIGPYTLINQIGIGGMGVVYAAAQTDPIGRTVALKIIKPGTDTRQVIARFEIERRALAMMDHPNIAKVLDAGATDTGRPYFVMELIDGMPITAYCDSVRMTLRERLVLLVSVCRAIQHAHQKGVIHRDVKPSNVLVTLYDDKPVPKVIDFGIAKAIDQRLTRETLNTNQWGIVGTLEYMSPEQADESAPDVDTRSDVYALGVLLYELLTGATPLANKGLSQAPYSVLLRRIREEEPSKPSTRLSKAPEIALIAGRRSIEQAQLTRMVRGDLDWIAMRALEKDRSRRYATANDLARDIQHFLDGEPVDAGPPSTRYRLKKYALKHRAALAMLVAFATVLASATGFSTWQAVRATREEAKAVRSAVEAKATLTFFREKVLAAARPKNQKRGLGRGVTLREAIVAAEPEIAAEFAGQPNVEASIRDTLGTTYLYLGDTAPAIRQYERAMAVRSTALGPDHPDTLTSMNNLATAYQADGRYNEAVALFERKLELSRSSLGPDHPDTLTSMNNLATSFRLAGRTAEAVSMAEEVLARRRAKLGLDHPDMYVSINNLAVAYQDAGRYAEAIPLHEQELEHALATLGLSHPDTLRSMNNVASASMDAGRLDEALPLFEKVLDVRRMSLGPDHPDTLTSMNNLAAAYQADGRLEDALTQFKKTLELRQAKLGPDHPDTLTSMNNLAAAYQADGRPEQALALFRTVFALRESKLGPDHPETLRSMNGLAGALLELKRWDEAHTLLHKCLILREKVGTDPWRRYSTMSQLGASLAGLGRHAEAEPLLIQGYEGLASLRSQVPATRRKDFATAATRVIAFYEAWGNPAKVAEWKAKLAPPAGPNTPKP